MTVRYRPARRRPEELVFCVTGVRTDLDPPRVLGYLLPSRSRRELRADRILAIDSPGGPQAAPHASHPGLLRSPPRRKTERETRRTPPPIRRARRARPPLGRVAARRLPRRVLPDSARPKNAEEWYRRAQREFKQADFDDAHDSVDKALAIVPDDPEVRTLAAEVALTSLDYAEVLRLLKGVHSTDAARLRGRALWYKGDLEAAADELEAMLNDPEVKDDWAKATTKLARRGAGRTPFTLSGGLLAAVEMVHVSPVAPYFVVPVEIDGEAALAMIATGTAEVVLDSRHAPRAELGVAALRRPLRGAATSPPCRRISRASRRSSARPSRRCSA